jgi:hypothetical protein
VSEAVALDSSGHLVFVLAAPVLAPEVAGRIADRLDELAAMGETNLEGPDQPPLSPEELARRHEAFFPGAEEPLAFNRKQRVYLILRDPPSLDTWKALVIELGDMLAGVWELRGVEAFPVSPPRSILRNRESRRAPFPWATILGAIVVLAGVALGVVALTRAEPAATPPDSGRIVEPPIRDVAFGVPADATHSQWIGQQRLLRTSDGRLVALYPGADGLQLVTDQSNQGRTWRSPLPFPDITPTSLSAAIDDNDNIHLAFTDGSGISYARLSSKGRGWEAPAVLPLDPDSASAVVDIDWEREGGQAYVVWAAESSEGQAPQWATISGGSKPSVVETGELAEPGDEIPVLVNIAAGPGSTLHATFRRGDSSFGWFGRTGLVQKDGTVQWGPEEQLSTDDGFGAAALAVDGQGTAHLVLRDSTTFRLLYFRRTEARGWSSPQTAVEAGSIEEIDLPALSVDTSSKLIYLFFQTNRFNSAGEVAVSVRDPATGWEGPYRIGPQEQGAAYPTSMATTKGQPIALWTKGGEAPSIQAARVIAP